jgi:hypothetical protein
MSVSQIVEADPPGPGHPDAVREGVREAGWMDWIPVEVREDERTRILEVVGAAPTFDIEMLSKHSDGSVIQCDDTTAPFGFRSADRDDVGDFDDRLEHPKLTTLEIEIRPPNAENFPPPHSGRSG